MIEIENLDINDIKLIKTKRHDDSRGFFQQNYHFKDYSDLGIKNDFVQDNWSYSHKGVLRGLHYQEKNSQAKLVQVIKGSIFDVAVDLRSKSPTFGKWVGKTLSDKNGYQLFIPRGFAHGFLVLESNTSLVYKCDDYYNSNDERGIIWNDPTINVKWPFFNNLIISNKDQCLPSLEETNFNY